MAQEWGGSDSALSKERVGAPTWVKDGLECEHMHPPLPHKQQLTQTDLKEDGFQQEGTHCDQHAEVLSSSASLHDQLPSTEKGIIVKRND